MKEFNVNNKRSGLFAKGITALSLSIALQGRACLNQGGVAGVIVTKTSDEKFGAMIANTRDISCTIDEKGRTELYAAVKYNQPKKVEIILKRYGEDNESGFQHKNPDFINACDSSGHTPLEEAIIQDNVQIVKLLIQNKYIDINKVGNNATSLLVALKNKRKEIANTLLNQPNIDIKTKDPTSGNTALHCAIENKWLDTTKKLIDLLKAEAPELLYAKNKKDKTVLHTAAYANNLDLFQKVLHPLIELSGINEVIKQLFEKTKSGKTVWECIYLSEVGLQPVSNSTNIKMFEYAINTVKDNLKPTDRDAILEGINRRERANRLQGGISKGYADALRKVVNSIPTRAAGA